MRIRWFGDPWPNAERRAGICDSDDYKVPVEKVMGQRCIECNEPITESQRGVITACDMRIWGHFMLELPETKDELTGDVEEAATWPVAAYHLKCWLEEVIGGELTQKILDRMHLNAGQRPLTTQEIDEMEASGVKLGDEDHDPGAGWFH